MKHQQYNEWMILSLCQELTEREQSFLNDHLADCAECREELKRMQNFHAAVAHYQPQEVSERELTAVRRMFRLRLHETVEHPSWWKQVLERVETVFPLSIRTAAAGFVVVIIGLGAGYALFHSAVPTTLPVQQASMMYNSNPGGELQISNVKFNERDDQTGAVDFTFDAVSSMHIRGNINDEHIQKILARALLNEQNPGTRLRTVDMIGSQVEQRTSPLSSEIKTTLITLLKHDPNPGVRKQALAILSNYLPDTIVTRAFLYVLANEKNTGLVIQAMNLLDVSKIEHRPMSNELQQLLQQKVQSEANQYIKIKAAAALQEMQQ